MRVRQRHHMVNVQLGGVSERLPPCRVQPTGRTPHGTASRFGTSRAPGTRRSGPPGACLGNRRRRRSNCPSYSGCKPIPYLSRRFCQLVMHFIHLALLTPRRRMRYPESNPTGRRCDDMVTKQRSPNYPGIDLETAIEAVHALHKGNLSQGQFTPDDAATAWGYRGPSGPVRVRLAALRQYGLLDSQRGENPKLSRRARTFLLRNQASREYRDELEGAALTPTFFREIRDSRPDASDGVLRQYLIVDRNFTDDGAERLIAVYRATMRLAGLDRNDTVSRLQEDDSSLDGEDDVSSITTERRPPIVSTAPPSLSADHTRVPLRLMGGALVAAVELPTAMTEAAWQQMVTMLEALKPGYIANEPDQRDHGSEPSDT